MSDGLGQVEIDGLRIAYRLAGEGQPVVFLHGFFGDHRVWRRQIELANEYQVVAWDAPGCGGSSVPPETWRLRDYAVCLSAFIHELGLARPHLVGNSFGGSLALQLYALDPSLPRSLVLADTYAGWSGSFAPEVVEQRLAGSLRDLGLPVEQVVAKWVPGFVTAAAPTSVVQELGEIIRDFNPEGMTVMIRALAEADLREVLPRVEAPTLLVWGGEDVRSPLQVADAIHGQMTGSRLVVMPAVGHLSHVEAPERFNQELRSFLASVST